MKQYFGTRGSELSSQEVATTGSAVDTLVSHETRQIQAPDTRTHLDDTEGNVVAI